MSEIKEPKLFTLEIKEPEKVSPQNVTQKKSCAHVTIRNTMGVIIVSTLIILAIFLLKYSKEYYVTKSDAAANLHSTANTTCAPGYTSICAPSITVISLLKSSDPIFALCATAAGLNSQLSPREIGLKACQSPTVGEQVKSILDGNLETKYLNFGNGDAFMNSPLKGVGTGFIVVPQSGELSVLKAFQFGTAGHSPNRDPITITIEGSQATQNGDLKTGSSWTLIYYGWSGINMTHDPGRHIYGSLQNIVNASPYKSYRVLVASQRGNDNSVQYSEVQLLGYFLS